MDGLIAIMDGTLCQFLHFSPLPTIKFIFYPPFIFIYYYWSSIILPVPFYLSYIKWIWRLMIVSSCEYSFLFIYFIKD